MNSPRFARTVGVAATAAAAVLAIPSVAQASAPTTVYVSAHNSGGGSACQHTNVHTIQAGVDRVAPGGTVYVCPGTYREQVDMLKRLTLQGIGNAVVDATGNQWGIGVGGDHSTVAGMTVRNAGVGLSSSQPPGDGIVTVASANGPKVGNYLTIRNNVLTGNTGSGINMVSTRGSLIQNNRSTANGIGINVVDDAGVPVQNNRIIGNVASNNVHGCGIALASHTGAGVIGNLVKDNTANGNGLPAGGAGVLLALGGPPVMNGHPTPLRDNQFVGNTADGNGHAGFEMHIHAPGANVTGNSVIGNNFGTNNSGGDYADPDTTAVYLGSAAEMTIVLKDNRLHDDVNGVFRAGPVWLSRSGNTFTNITHPYPRVPTYGG